MHQKNAILILAAGSSSRLGQPKQLLDYKGETLIEHVVKAALESECPNIYVVLGAYEEKIRPVIAGKAVNILFNPEWKEGMGNTISFGLSEIKKDRDISSVLILLCDQPFVQPDIINKFFEIFHTTGKTIIASSYGEETGVPVLFAQPYFRELALLDGDRGAKSIFQKNIQETALVEFPKGIVDIDTMEDYDNLLST